MSLATSPSLNSSGLSFSETIWANALGSLIPGVILILLTVFLVETRRDRRANYRKRADELEATILRVEHLVSDESRYVPPITESEILLEGLKGPKPPKPCEKEIATLLQKLKREGVDIYVGTNLFEKDLYADSLGSLTNASLAMFFLASKRELWIELEKQVQDRIQELRLEASHIFPHLKEEGGFIYCLAHPITAFCSMRKSHLTKINQHNQGSFVRTATIRAFSKKCFQMSEPTVIVEYSVTEKAPTD